MLLRICNTSQQFLRRFVHIEARIVQLGYHMPPVPPDPKGNYMVFSREGNLVHISGHLPQLPDGTLVKGRLGENVSVEEGQIAARLAGLNMLATIKKAAGGDLDNVKRILRVTGFINSTNDFTAQATVMNGCSDLLGEVFGVEIGRHSRSALGVNVLPLGVPIEVEAIVMLKDGTKEL
jgi:enamine deaminase RidA (YjgF/YER057c/UK114 family)